MFILQVFCVALFSGLFFLLLIPNAPEHRVVDGSRRSDSGKVQELKVRRSGRGRDRRSKVSADCGACGGRLIDPATIAYKAS